MIHPEKIGRRERMSFSKIKDVMEMPNLISIQTDSYKWFIEEGLREAFLDVFPISDPSENLILEFVDYILDDTPKYDVEECKERKTNYSASLKVKVRLVVKEDGEIKDVREQHVFMADFPLMTRTGTFIINGAERVIVSQLIRSPGAYFSVERDKYGKELYNGQIIPNRGAWLEYETDASDCLYARVDRTKKVPITVLIRALGLGTNEEIINFFGEEKRLMTTFEKDSSSSVDEGLIEIYKKLRPGEPESVDSAKGLFIPMFFDQRRYDLMMVGRFKLNKKLALATRITGQYAFKDIVNPLTGEILVSKDEIIDEKTAWEIQNCGINTVEVKVSEDRGFKIIGNGVVDINKYELPFDVSDLNIDEMVNFRVLSEILDSDLSNEEKKEQIKDRMSELLPKHITVEDIYASISYNLGFDHGIGTLDDIDHLGNRRIRSVGELLQNQFRIGLSRLERTVKERMISFDPEEVTPSSLVNVKPVNAALKEFFGSSQLSQFMDQTNPLGELTHKRRYSALGPGGLSRDRAGFEVRDVHHSHYGRVCPIETPEGPNIGLIGSLATFSRVNKYGFIETPYRRVKDGAVTGDIDYIPADEEGKYTIAQANEPLMENGSFEHSKVTGRAGFERDFVTVEKDKVDYMDISPKQVVSVATSMIPFLENDDANRALMGANMQRQAVPLLKPQAPMVATGIEHRAAKDSGVCVVSEVDGVVKRVTATEIIITDDATKQNVKYKLLKYKRTNQNTCINQIPIVKLGDRIKKGEVIADGPSTENGDLSLGRNILIGFMTWEGYNYEDAIIINEKLVKEDALTSIHIEEFDCEAKETKLGSEEITRDIPNVGEDALRNLDERGVIRVGAEVKSDDILVGKVTPKGESDPTAEEKLLRAIFGEKAREVRDTSLKVPHGEKGVVVDVKVYTKENGDELKPNVNKLVRVYIAIKRKIQVGDKMAGRHGNKGVISRVVPEEDMPFLPDGTPLEILLSPMGVPSRMNIGQVLEVHLGLACKALGIEIATPVFDGAKEEDIMELLEQAGYSADGKIQLYDGRTGEPFDNRVTVGYMYMLRLHHIVDEKMHARATGPYSLVTQQPLGGKAQMGGQRFGEMEVWALEAYGAAHTLQEILTVKSDDVSGRVKTYESIIKGENIPKAGVPESFKVLIKEFQSLCLDVNVLGERNEIIDIKDDEDEDLVEDLEQVEASADGEFVEELDDIEFEEISEVDILEDDGDIESEDLDFLDSNILSSSSSDDEDEEFM